MLKRAGADKADPMVRDKLVEEKYAVQEQQESSSWWDIFSSEPPNPALQASALKAFEAAIDEIADRLAGKEPALANDPGIAKVRRFH